MFKLEYTGENHPVNYRDAIMNNIDKMMEKDERVCYLDADLASAIAGKGLLAKYPNRAINCGVQEQNMAGVAAGMASQGMLPYIHSFGAFAGRRCYDQVFMSSAYGQNPVRVIGSDPGVTAVYNGGTHMPFEDVALYRCIPNSTVLDAADATQAAWMAEAVKESKGVAYIRTPRKVGKRVYADGSTFEIGKAAVLKDGADVAIFASGIMVAEAIEAGRALEKEGINAAVIDVVSIKPIDEDTVIKYAEKCGAIVTAENSFIKGGLFDAVGEVVLQQKPVAMEYVGVNERFGEVGSLDYLVESFGLNAKTIVEKAKKAISRK